MSEPRICVHGEEAEARLKELSLAMCGGENLDDYVEECRAQGQLQCTNVWSKGIIAYRCRTCQNSDSSAICVDCFQSGSHWDHDYVMYHSESGGCCDCGDPAAWKESGFCSTHQCVDVLEGIVRDELLEPTRNAVQYVLRQIVAWVKKLNDKLTVGHVGHTDIEETMAMLYLNWSQKVCAVDALRNIVCEEIINCSILYQTESSTSSLDILLDCLGWMPEKLIEAETTLFLQLLYKNEFKDQFLDCLNGKYEKMIINSVKHEGYMKNYKGLDTNLDRVMVQLFNDPEMTTYLIHKYNLLELFIGVFAEVVSSAVDSETAVVNVEHQAINCKVYLRPQGDLRLIVAHGNIAIHLLTKQPELFPKFLEVLTKLQWMNSYDRDDQEIEFENSWTLAIQLEMNSMAIIVQLISRCFQDPSVGKQTLVRAATYTLKALKQYLIETKRIAERGEITGEAVSLHIPLHRAFGAILQKLVLLPWDNEERGFLSGLKEEDDFNFTEDEILHLLDHPLRISVWMAQIRAQMWRNTSEEFSRLELIYRGSFWHDQSMDLDILLLQFCTIAFDDLQETIFMRIAERFNFKGEVTKRITPDGRRRPAHISLLQDFVKLILLIVRERRNLGRTEEDEAQDKCLEYDVIQWLCVRDQTYSQLCRALSAIPMDHQKLNAMLEKVAVYHEPKVADRGYYQLKPEYWEQFDPLFAHYYLNELEDAEDRAVKVGKLEHYWRIKAPPAAGAPYDRLSGLLHTKACHLFLLNVLDEVRYLVDVETTATAGEALGVTALQMMAVLVSDSRKKTRNSSDPQLPMDEFPTEDITVNIHIPIRTPDGTDQSIFDMLQELVRYNQCTRLVDSVNHVLELLCFSTNEKTRAFEVDSQGAEDMQRRLRKEQRQKAILEEFAAKRKAFMEIQNVSDDEGSDDDSEMEASNVADVTVDSKSFSASTSATLAKASVPVAEVDYVAMETFSEMKECVLCKRKKDEKNSSPCWIALVQRYNFPCQVLKRGEAVEKTSEGGLDSKFHQSTVKSMDIDINPDLDQLVTVGRSTESDEASAIDFSTVQHVQCCGHQMHYDCFQSHINSLMLNHNAGRGVVDPGKAEFLCPICRRLANVLLPVVDPSLLSRKHDSHDDGKSLQETGNKWGMFWQSNKNLESAMDSFCCQVLRVEDQSPQSFLSPPSRFEISQALWEGLVMNVVHCEVETREGFLKTDAASSSCSSAPIKLSDECTWGGDSSHWIALRELGKLAVLSNTLPGAVQEKSQRLRMLWKSLRLPGRKENLAGLAACSESSPVQAGTSELENIIHEIFHERPPGLGESSDLLEVTDLAPGSSHCQDEASFVQNAVLTPSSTYEQKEEQLSFNTSSNYSMQLEGSKDDFFLGPKYGVTQRPVLATPDPIANDPQQKFEITFKEADFEDVLREGNVNDTIDISHPSSLEQQQSSMPKDKRNSNWIADTLRNGVFTADPFRLLTLLLIIFNGEPDRSSLHSMVKFAYTIAVLQAQIAIDELKIEGAEVEGFVQRACLPFLRRAAMLVQIITREDFRGRHGLSGTKVMEFLNLQLALQLPGCAQILQTQVHGGAYTLATQLRHLYEPVKKNFRFELRKVPRKAQLFKLPRVFQELLLENIHNRKTCDTCKDVPVDPAICLICGVLLCCGTECCKRDGVGECSRHAAEESAGVGIFLLLRSTQLLLVRNNRTCMGLSLYLDIHGEEDLYLRRSQLLYLSDLRLNEVRRLWMTAAFDYDSYILRNSQSRPNVY